MGVEMHWPLGTERIERQEQRQEHERGRTSGAKKAAHYSRHTDGGAVVQAAAETGARQAEVRAAAKVGALRQRGRHGKGVAMAKDLAIATALSYLATPFPAIATL